MLGICAWFHRHKHSWLAVILLGFSPVNLALQSVAVDEPVSDQTVAATASESSHSENNAVDLPTVDRTTTLVRSRPNVVLILADDLGFTDIAPYGGEIQTPTLAALAANGLSFTNYHTAASCAPTRAMLLTGVSSHRAGVPNIPEMIPPEQRQHAITRGRSGTM